MRTFEYLVVQVVSDRVREANGHWLGELDPEDEGAEQSCPELVDYLASAGAQGWELVALDPEEVGTARLYFKRTHGG